MIPAARSSWSPLRLPGLLAWFTVGRNSVVLNATNEATSWLNFPTGNIALTSSGADEPDWKENGWGQGISAIEMAGGASPTEFSTTTASLAAPGNGTDLPFSIFCTLQPTSTDEQTVLGWRHSAAASLSVLRITADPANVLQYRRTDSGSTSVDVTAGGGEVGLVRRRAGVLHSGTAATLLLETAVVGSGASDVGALTCDAFAISTSATPLTALIADFVVLNQQATVADYLAYYNWSRMTLGY